ncbi:hypothetical protein AGJ25_04560 [Cronobacter sakazakii]|nr:hypothetical protein [Cronobacter sakazakii]EGT5650479.1 hypothetical protein [Cronobacter sakazakii]EGT5750131.1 hypothetical protein [Cronobacter sakazakii]EGT5755628.1 hypothetical protein [Cronobacter sakazakii]ELY5893897.1 hypothetical protein [Cronobacter sakazakii]
MLIAHLIFWIGVIMIIPTFSRFCFSASALLWRRLFPTRIFEFRYHDENTGSTRTLTVKVPRKKGKMLASLIDEAIAENSKQK